MLLLHAVKYIDIVVVKLVPVCCAVYRLLHCPVNRCVHQITSPPGNRKYDWRHADLCAIGLDVNRHVRHIRGAKLCCCSLLCPISDVFSTSKTDGLLCR